jgi:diaminohydroxyphosphoribosylaminopyrimidine deaminase / 5-amino-6-(5-phosphoribosylamino)uracil reductase
MGEEFTGLTLSGVIPPIHVYINMSDNCHITYLEMAMKLAKLGKGKTSPNPMVGAIIVKNRQIVGRGYHKKAGQAHAEIMAIRSAGTDARGGTLYVNLEPCCHFGRTQPCTNAIIEAGIKRVVYSIADPNPKVNGKGAKILGQAGVQVISGILSDEAALLNEVYLKYITTGLPFVVLKTAQSLDGRIATSTGESQWITGLAGRKFAHQLRTESDAVVIGAGTALADNPQLTVRLVKGKNPYRIIIGRHINSLMSLHLFRDNDDARTIFATSSPSAKKIKQKNLIVWEIIEKRDGLDLTDFLKKAGQFGISSVMVEGGGRLATSLLHHKLVDKHHLMIAPIIIGKGTDSTGDLHIRKLADAITYKSYQFESCGRDILFTGYPEWK